MLADADYLTSSVGDAKGFKLYTLDHTTGSERLDLAEAWDASPTAQSQDAFWPACLPFNSNHGLASDQEGAISCCLHSRLSVLGHQRKDLST